MLCHYSDGSLLNKAPHSLSQCPYVHNTTWLISSLQEVTTQLASANMHILERPTDVMLRLLVRKALVETLLHRRQVKVTFQGFSITGFDAPSCDIAGQPMGHPQRIPLASLPPKPSLQPQMQPPAQSLSHRQIGLRSHSYSSPHLGSEMDELGIADGRVSVVDELEMLLRGEEALLQLESDDALKSQSHECPSSLDDIVDLSQWLDTDKMADDQDAAGIILADSLGNQVRMKCRILL
jgi:hypothetical protein